MGKPHIYIDNNGFWHTPIFESLLIDMVQVNHLQNGSFDEVNGYLRVGDSRLDPFPPLLGPSWRDPTRKHGVVWTFKGVSYIEKGVL